MQRSELAVLISGLTLKNPFEFEDLNSLYERVKSRIKRKDIDKELKYIEENNIKIITCFDKDYPESLKNIEYPPLVLYVKGKLKEEPLSIAIVGSRYPSGYGYRVISYIVPYLVESGFSIISGLAMGIDASAHKTALQHNGYTIAVLGNGLSITYPPQNRELYKQIESKGCIISEFGVFEPPNRYNFPARNRIIAGLARATIVVEADLKSGSLITARLTAEQGKTVFSVPGEIFSKRSRGTNKLISEGAIPLIDINTVLEHFYLELKSELEKEEKNTPKLSQREKMVIDVLTEPLSEDEISIKTGIPIEEISETLFDLELEGLIRHNPGGKFEKT